VEDAVNAELAVRREAHSRRTGAVAQVMEALFAHIDSRATIDVARRLHGVSKSTQLIVDDLRNELNEFEPPVLDADRLGPYVVLIEAADLVAPDLVPGDIDGGLGHDGHGDLLVRRSSRPAGGAAGALGGSALGCRRGPGPPGGRARRGADLGL
jgi:hypothetical protein